MATIATISSSPSDVSRTDAVLSYVAKRLLSRGHQVTPIVLRDLPAEHFCAAAPTIRRSATRSTYSRPPTPSW